MTATATETIFDLEFIYDLMDRYEDEGDDFRACFLNRVEGRNHLTILDKDVFEGTLNVKTYLFPNSTEVYAQMDAAMDSLVRTSLHSSQYSCAITAFFEILGAYQIANDSADM